jgi:hypothetical protein
MRGERVFFHGKNRLRRLESANGHCHRDFFFHFGAEVYQIRVILSNSIFLEKQCDTEPRPLVLHDNFTLFSDALP